MRNTKVLEGILCSAQKSQGKLVGAFVATRSPVEDEAVVQPSLVAIDAPAGTMTFTDDHLERLPAYVTVSVVADPPAHNKYQANRIAFDRPIEMPFDAQCCHVGSSLGEAVAYRASPGDKERPFVIRRATVVVETIGAASVFQYDSSEERAASQKRPEMFVTLVVRQMNDPTPIDMVVGHKYVDNVLPGMQLELESWPAWPATHEAPQCCLKPRVYSRVSVVQQTKAPQVHFAQLMAHRGEEATARACNGGATVVVRMPSRPALVYVASACDKRKFAVRRSDERAVVGNIVAVACVYDAEAAAWRYTVMQPCDWCLTAQFWGKFPEPQGGLGVVPGSVFFAGTCACAALAALTPFPVNAPQPTAPQPATSQAASPAKAKAGAGKRGGKKESQKAAATNAADATATQAAQAQKAMSALERMRQNRRQAGNAAPLVATDSMVPFGLLALEVCATDDATPTYHTPETDTIVHHVTCTDAVTKMVSYATARGSRTFVGQQGIFVPSASSAEEHVLEQEARARGWGNNSGSDPTVYASNLRNTEPWSDALAKLASLFMNDSTLTFVEVEAPDDH